jgi:hypothetical protein
MKQVNFQLYKQLLIIDQHPSVWSEYSNPIFLFDFHLFKHLSWIFHLYWKQKWCSAELKENFVHATKPKKDFAYATKLKKGFDIWNKFDTVLAKNFDLDNAVLPN